MTTPSSARSVRPRLISIAAVILALVATMAGVAVPSAHGQDADAVAYYVPETSQVIAEPFLSTWTDLGGPDRLGMPVTTVDAPDAGKIQYFERGALKVTKVGAVEAVPVGRALLDRPDPSNPLRTGRRSPSPHQTRPFTRLSGPPTAASVVYDETAGHAVKGSMLVAYDQAGAADTMGAPLSEAYVSGGLRVQWFEMGRLDDRAGAAAPGPVGVELALLDGADLAPKRQGSLATVDLSSGNLARASVGPDPADAGPDRASAGPSFSPSRIQIPAIGVDAYVEAVGIDGGVMGIPSDPWNVGWYPALGGPGGNTVMAGHKDWWTTGPAVFWSLGALGAGNEIYLYDGAGNVATYVVYESFTVDASADSGSVIGDQGGDTLTLITCGGSFDGSEYNLRIIVRASRAT